MRAIWSGSLSFGLVNIPIKLYSAVQPKELSFNMLHKEDLSPIRFARVCKHDGKEVPYEDIVKGFEYESGDYVILQDEDFKNANLKETSSIEIMNFVAENEIDPLMFEKPYYLEPEKAKKPYALLIDALKKTNKVGVVKYVLRNKEHLGIVRPEGNLLVLEQLRFKDEIRKPEGLILPESNSTKKNEIDLAVQLINQLTVKFKPENYRDTYSDELRKIIHAKAKGKEVKPKGEIAKPVKVNELMDILKKSLQKEKHGK